MRRACFAATILLALAGCGPTVRTTYLGDVRHPPADTQAAVRLYSVGAPECPFEELALLTAVLQDEVFNSREDALAALQERARHIGAHAIVGVANYDVPSGDGYAPGYKGTAIRFTDEDCTQ